MTVITLHVSITEKYTTENNIFHRKYLVCPEMYLERDNYGKPSYSGPKQVSWLKIESFWQDHSTGIIHSLVILLSLVYIVRQSLPRPEGFRSRVFQLFPLGQLLSPIDYFSLIKFSVMPCLLYAWIYRIKDRKFINSKKFIIFKVIELNINHWEDLQRILIHLFSRWLSSLKSYILGNIFHI